MNIKKLVGTLALSLVAFAATPRARAAGNISEIFPVDGAFMRIESPVSSVDDPLVGGDVVRFGITMIANDPDRAWRMHHTSKTSSEAADLLQNPFAIGIYVSGELRKARHVGDITDGNATTFYFEYEVKPGDLALPVVLAVGQTVPKAANGNDYRDTEYYVDRVARTKWTIDDSTVEGVAATTNAVLSFMSAEDVSDADCDLRGAGFYVKTVGFDDDQEEDAWRSVAAGTKATGTIHVDPYPTNSVTLYVWSMDESIVKVDGSSDVFINTNKTATSKRSVAAIKLRAYVQDYTFTFTGGSDAVGKETQLVLSGNKNFSYNSYTLERYRDYQTATVKVTTPPDPYMTITDASGNQQISLEANTNSTSTAGAKEMRLKFSKAYEKGPVTVTLKQQVNGEDVSAEDDYLANRYFSIHLTQDTNPATAVWTNAVTLKAGETEARFYVFPLGTTDVLKDSGVTLVPDVSDQGRDVIDFFTPGVANQKSATIKITDQMPEVSVSAPSSGYKNDKASINVTVNDNWRDLQPALNTAGYTVKIRIGGQEVLSTNHVAFTGSSKTFDVTLPAEGHPLTGVVEVTDATHAIASTASFEIDVDPARTATPVFYPTSDMTSTNENLKAYEEGHYFAEGESPYFRVTLTSDAQTDMYAFLVPANEAASNCVSCAAYSNGLYIASGSRNSSAATIKFLDGYSATNPMRAKFSVELRSAEDINDPTGASYGSSYSFRSVELVCTNVSPTIIDGSMNVNDTAVANGGTLGARIPAGATVNYKARLNDNSSIDLAATGDKAILTRWQWTDYLDGAVTTRYVTNTTANGYVTCPITFNEANAQQTVRVWARDKDDRLSADVRDIIDWGPCVYEFKVNVTDKPHVTVSRDTAGTQTAFAFNESVNDRIGFVYVTLSERPTYGDPEISATNPLVVELEVERYGSDGVLKLATNRVEFTDTATVQKQVKLDVATLNGQFLSQFTIKAKVVTETKNAYGSKWRDYYAEGEADVTINNEMPEIVKVNASRTNGMLSDTTTNNCIAGEAIKVHWQISDIPADITNGNFRISWSVDPSSDSPTGNKLVLSNELFTTGKLTYKVNGRKAYVEGDYYFTVPMIKGETVVEMTVEDGDSSNYASRQWTINVVPTNPIYVHVFGPEEAPPKYRSAKGVGQGVVAAKGATRETTTGFYQNWDYGDSSTYAELYAWAYPSTNTWDRYLLENGVTNDNGVAKIGEYLDKGNFPNLLNVPAAIGVALTPGGNDAPEGGPYYDWSTKGGSDRSAGEYDNYFYRWVMINPSEDEASAGEETGVTRTDASPTAFPLTRSSRNVALDSGNEAPVEVEAVFSREMFAKDNLGDINADYVPDMYVSLYGIGADGIGYFPSDDLASLRDFNDDEDYFPNVNGAAYSTLIPSLPSSWTSGQPFTARYEIRGYGDGLNDAPKLAGIKGYRMDPNYTNELVEVRKAARDYTELEMLAWSLAGYDVEWSPECPSDPTKADTDEDGFADGYEYYFWYRAHVGDPEYFKTTGKIRRLTGRKFDPHNPGVGTVITSEEIEKAMNPRVAYGDGNGESGKLMDSDNDGLPDLLEYELGTNPFDFDTDGDGLPDGWEIMIAGLDPLTSQTYVGEKSDTLLNLDKDAMAISSYALEPLQNPVPTDYEHAKRWTFAVIDEDGDTAGVQWYAMANEPAAPVVGETCANGWRLTTVEGSTSNTFFCAYTEDHTNLVAYADADGVTRLGETVEVRKIVAYKPDGAENAVDALGYPCTLVFGTEVEVEAVTDANPVYSYKIAAAIASADANACWIYGKGSANAEQGEVADTADSYGCLALARQKGVPEGAEIAAFPSAGRDVAFLHYLCYQEFGFDPRTAWSETSPTTVRWSTKDEIIEGTGSGVGFPSRTRAYAAYDEFLVYSFFLCNAEDGKTPGYTTGLAKAGDDDEVDVSWADAWYALTTNPNGPTDSDLANKANGSTTTETTTSGHYYGRNSTNGADTDGDGVPDGWELYVMAGPKAEGTGAYVFATPYDSFKTGIPAGMSYTTMPKSYLSPFVAEATSAKTCSASYMGDCDTDLNEFKNFQGLDSISVYTNVSTTVKFEDGFKWFNKFFPTDPWAADTDGDGLKDSAESEEFGYGTFETTLVDDGKKTLFPGGGLNPCSVDTDKDGLPDPWEAQFAGTKASIITGKESDGYRDGMDGTVKDAYTKINQEDDDVNRDYDNDGLENWQEYLTGTMRCWRYDDPISPFDYIPTETYYKAVTNKVGDVEVVTLKFDAEHAAKTLKAAGKLDKDDVNEFWYRTLVDTTSEIYNPGLVTGMSSGAQYFSRVTNPWDPVYVEPSAGGAYYWFYDRVNDMKFELSWKAVWKATLELSDDDLAKIGIVPTKYACCSPIDPDSDHDGMDDYYELFHGMNPLLGQSGGGANWVSLALVDDDTWSGQIISSVDPVDLVYDSLGGKGEGNDMRNIPQAWGENDESTTSFKNFWQRKAEKDGTALVGNGYDFVAFPWLNGSATADPDGDGIRNQEESIMPLVNPTTAWHHTDPTPLWMTDVSYSNSLVRMFYCLPTRGDTFKITGATFTYPATNSVAYKFVNFGGFASTDDGIVTVAFNPDLRWPLVSSASSLNFFASFEQNEGYDSDHDGLMDQDELGGKYNGKTDPLDADSPSRRQAMYFQGEARPSILQTMPFVYEYHPLVARGGRYPDDMSFLQFTVECWVKAESLDNATIVERMVNVGRSSPDDLEYLRRNFSLGIKGGKWQALFDPNDTTMQTVEVLSQADATTEWTHIAVTYDMNVLKIFVNGKLNNKVTSNLQPTYGSSAVGVAPGQQLALRLYADRVGMSYWADMEYASHAIVVGAAFKTNADGADGTALDLTGNVYGFDAYKNFYKGYVDEIRIWDGARSETEVGSAYKKRFTSEDAKDNRDEFYAQWSANTKNDVYCGRYAKDGSGNAYALPAELRFHWAFDSIFGGASEGAVAKAPAGFNYLGATLEGDGARAVRSRPENYEIPWWTSVLGNYPGTVYDDPAWICWVPNTVTHLPRYDGTTLDSFYWSEDFKGSKNGLYTFTHTAEPVSLWRQVLFNAASATAYLTTGTRYGLVTGTDGTTSNTTFTTIYEFTGRHLNQCGDDMLALGGAFAKHVDEMWDSQGPSANWEVSGTDSNGNGLPDWWEEIAEDFYRDDDVTGSGVINWTTQVRWPDQDGSVITAGEAYLRDLARGYHCGATGHAVIDDRDGDLVQRADENGNSIPDWWEKMYQIEGEDAFDDHDNDGLCNLVEYILSERFNIRDADGNRLIFNPTIPCSVMQGVPDYFFKVGDLYVGEIFADHDFIEDSWERQYDQSYASTLVYDVKTDNDDDGWSTFAEARYSQQVSPIRASEKFHFDSQGTVVNDFPIPAIQMTVRYNGSRSAAVEGCSYGVWVSRDLSASESIDATYWIEGATKTDSAKTGTSSTTLTVSSNEYKRVLGDWSNGHVYGTMTPGFVNANTIVLRMKSSKSAASYSWRVKIVDDAYNAEGSDGWTYSREWSHWEYASGTYAEYVAAKNKYGSNVEFLSSSSGYINVPNITVEENDVTGTATVLYNGKKTLGTVNLTTGEYDFDLGVFSGGYATVAQETTDGTAVENTYSLENMSYAVIYSANISTGIPRRFYLGESDTGYVREGKNQIFVWADLNGDKKFDIGEPCGFVRDVDIGWRTCKAEVEVFDHSPTLPRTKISASEASSNKSSLSGETASSSESTNSTSKTESSASASELVDRGMTLSAFCATLKERVVEKNLPYDRYTNEMQKIEWMNANLWRSPEVDEDATELTRIRIVRWALNGRPVYDAYADPEVVFDKKMRFSNRTFLTEADVLTNGVFDLDWEKLRSEVMDSRNVQLTVGNVTNVSYLVVVGEGKTYWDDASDTNSCPRILDCVLERRFTRKQPVAEPYSPKEEGSIVYAAHPTFSWTITDEDDDRYDGCTAFDIQILETGSDTVVWESGTQLLPPRDSKGRYTWAAPVYVVDDLEPSVNYRWRVSVMNAKFPTPEFDDASEGVFRIEPEALGLGIGQIPVCVRYFGPRKTILDQGLVRVEAFTSPDFTGLPVARVTVPTSEYDAVASTGSNQVAQVALTGLPYGKYYVRAYIDSAQYGETKTLDDWESWGYYCTRDGSTAEIFSPVSAEVSSAKSGVCTIYVEDADTNGNRIPDAYEMHMNGGSLDKGTERLDETLHCGLAINTDLVTTNDLAQTTTSSSDYTGYIAQIVSAFRSRAIASLATGVEPSSIVVDAATGCLVTEATVEGGTFVITDVTFDKGAGTVTLTLDADVKKNETVASVYNLASKITVKVLHTETLAGEWQEKATATFVVTGATLDSEKVVVKDLNLNDTTGFFKVVVE